MKIREKACASRQLPQNPCSNTLVRGNHQDLLKYYLSGLPESASVHTAREKELEPKMKICKGIILAGGSGTRLAPATNVVSKHFFPIYNKPLIYYPLTTLMLADIRDILIITTPNDESLFRRLLGCGSQWGITLKYLQQPSPLGIAHALTLAEEFQSGEPLALVLGDNIFSGPNLRQLLKLAIASTTDCTIFLHHVLEPKRYGVAELDYSNTIISIEEKPRTPKSNLAITGLYLFDADCIKMAKLLVPSARGELEITDLIRMYLVRQRLRAELLDKEYTWFDSGTHDSLLEASQFISTIENRDGLMVACPEEIAFRQNWISASELKELAVPLANNPYGQYLNRIVEEIGTI